MNPLAMKYSRDERVSTPKAISGGISVAHSLAQVRANGRRCARARKVESIHTEKSRNTNRLLKYSSFNYLCEY